MPQQLNQSAFLDAPLIDHHCHGVVEQPLQRPEFESMISESNWAAPDGSSAFESQLGFAIRRWCAPVLDLEPHASPERYLERRAELDPVEVNRRLLGAARIDRYLIDTGYRGDDILSPEGMAVRASASADEVVRLERLMEQLAEEQPEAATFADGYRRRLASALRGAVGVKTIAAYRIGLDFDPSRPTDAEAADAAGRWLSSLEPGEEARVEDPVLIRFGIWCAVDLAQAIQFHIGFGDPDVDLHRCNPLLLTEWLRETRTSGARALLLHCYPFHREAGYLAHAFPHVFCDVGLAVNYVGARAPEIIAESLELAPFDKVLFSSDAFGLAELYHLGAQQFSRGLLRVVDSWIARDEWSVADAERVIRKIAFENAERAYRLDPNPRFAADGSPS